MLEPADFVDWYMNEPPRDYQQWRHDMGYCDGDCIFCEEEGDG